MKTILYASILSLLFLPVILSWWNCNWKYRIPIVVQSTSYIKNYAFNLTIDTASLISSGKLNINCSDIRFTFLYPNGTEVEIPYWIESGCNTNNTIIWIRVPYVSTTPVTVFMYYGNPDAISESSKSSVFPNYVPNAISTYSTTFNTQICDNPTSSCDTSTNVICRDTISGGIEPNQPNTIYNSCSDGTWGTCHSDESTERIIVNTTTSLPFIGGNNVLINVTYYCWGTADYVAIWVSTDLGNTWNQIYQGNCPSAGFYSVVVNYTLPQNTSDYYLLIRGQILYNSAPSSACITGPYNDHDDLIVYVLKGGNYVNYTIGPEEYAGLREIVIETPANNTNLTSDILQIKVKGVGYCPLTLNGTIFFTYPTQKSFSLICSGNECYNEVDLNTLLYKIGIASDALPIEYNISLTDQWNKTTSVHLINYIRTTHNVTILSPTVGSIVLGSGFSIKVQTNSILKILACYPHLPLGARAEKIIIDNSTKTCEIWVDLSNYCGTNTITFNVTIENTAGVNSTSVTQTHYIYDPQITLHILEPTSNLSQRYLKLVVEVNKYPLNGVLVPTTKKFNVTINGVNYTLYGTDDGYLILNLCHKAAEPPKDIYGKSIPSLFDLFGYSSGYLNITIYGLGRCGYANKTSIVVFVPEAIFKVNFTPPTPENKSILKYLLLEVQGKIENNILANPICELWISKDNGFSWIKLKDLDRDCYGYIVNDEFDLNNLYYDAINGYYILLYKIRIVDTKWNETNESEIRVVYIPYNATPIPTISPGTSPSDAQKIISSAINNNFPAVLLESGIHKLNIIIDPQGKNFKLLGGNSILEPYYRGLPVITVKSGNATIYKLTIRNAIFNIKIENGTVSLSDVKVYGGLYGLEVKQGNIFVKNSIFQSKLAGIKANKVSGTIENSVLSGKVWGVYVANTNNLTIENSRISAKVFGFLLENGTNVKLVNNTILSSVFGIYLKSNNNTIEKNKVYAQVFGIKTVGGNIIKDNIISGIRVFGIYSSGPLYLYNNTIYSKLFGFVGTGNASKLYVIGAKLGIKLSGNGTISFLRLDDTLVNITYNGNFLFIAKDPTKHPYGLVYTGEGIFVLGSGTANITFLYNTNKICYVYRILGSLIQNLGLGFNVTVNKLGIYALYCS